MDMHRRHHEISQLTTEELDGVSGGMKNNQTEAWAAFQTGIIKGFIEASGGRAVCSVE
jgi:hypothetical protein